jgi:NAD(P)-dependent dehydrogenase (short-subunit alcohol dehydrogenase family)
MKNIFITGVSTGIGYDTVAYFTALGYRVFGSVRKAEDHLRLEKTFSDNFIALTFDVTKPEQIETARQQVEGILAGEPLLALVKNAGFAQGGPMALLPDTLFRQQIEANLFGVRNVTNAFLPLLGASKYFTGQPGKIINIRSISGIFNTPMNGAYCVSKHALESMAEVYRRGLRMYGIQVSSLVRRGL